MLDFFVHKEIYSFKCFFCTNPVNTDESFGHENCLCNTQESGTQQFHHLSSEQLVVLLFTFQRHSFELNLTAQLEYFSIHCML